MPTPSEVGETRSGPLAAGDEEPPALLFYFCALSQQDSSVAVGLLGEALPPWVEGVLV